MDMTNDLTELLAARWYTLDQPWADSNNAGLTILAGNPDPHVGVAIADCGSAFDELELHEQQAIAQHIVDLHNAAIRPRGQAHSCNIPGCAVCDPCHGL